MNKFQLIDQTYTVKRQLLHTGFEKKKNRRSLSSISLIFLPKIILAAIILWIGAGKSAIAQSADYGDAPDTFGNASHTIPTTPKLYLGNEQPDSEADTQLVSADSAGDDDAGKDDEDAFVVLPNVPFVDPVLTEVSLGRTYSLNVPVTNDTGADATLHGWIDFNQNGKFEAVEHQSATVNPAHDSAKLSWDLPSTTILGDTHARFRLTSDELVDNSSLLDPLGLIDIDERSQGRATDGEVEDYSVSVAIPLYDYGDAPDTSSSTKPKDYQTTESDQGPAHIVINTNGLQLSLGRNIDGDNGELQNAPANADDLDKTNVDITNTLVGSSNTRVDDEDGVSNFPPLTAKANQTYTLSVSAINNIPLVNAYLVGYIDFNRDGDFKDPGEKSATVTVSPFSTAGTSISSASGSSSGTVAIFDNDLRTFQVNFTTPAKITPGKTYARFRLGSVREIVESATDLTLTTNKREVNNGEVEDYQLTIKPKKPNK